MRNKLLSICMVVAMILISQQAFADWSFSTVPSNGMISGKPGATIGWGYSISNLDTSTWLVISGINASSFQFGMPDDSIFDYPILAPLTSVTVPYDGSKGLYQLTWDTSAPEGLVNVGSFTLTAEYYDSNPFAGGNFQALAPDKSVDYAAAVEKVSSVPVPAALWLFGSGLIGLLGFRTRLRKQAVTI
jgi:hypothetical protein